MEPIVQSVTGSSSPQPGTEAEWAANVDVVRVTNDILDNVGILAHSGIVAEGHTVTVIGQPDLGAVVHGVVDGPVSIPAGQQEQFTHNGGEWRLVE